jgi:hypothetical protein
VPTVQLDTGTLPLIGVARERAAGAAKNSLRLRTQARRGLRQPARRPFQRGEDFLGKDFALVLRIDPLPTRRSDNSNHR